MSDPTRNVVELKDGDIVAIDWNYHAVHDAIDVYAPSEVVAHSSVNELQETSDSTFALASGLSKFLEEEKLDDYTCPKCRGEPPTAKADTGRFTNAY